MTEGLKLRCVGTGDAFGSGGRLNACFHLQLDSEQILLDCGCSSLIGMQRCGIEAEAIDSVVVSHLHGDHFGGLPFLLLEAKYVSRRQRPLTLIGPPDLQRQLDAALQVLYPGTADDGFGFPLIYRQLDPESCLQQGAFKIYCRQVKHGRSPHAYALRLEAAGKAIAYTGDTEWTDSLIELSNDSDLLIAECFAYAQPVPSHLDYQTLQQHRHELNCKRLVLTHLGPEMLEKQTELSLEILNDGDMIDL